jgi:hypothetical protein
MFPFEDVRLDITHEKSSQNNVLMDYFRTYATCVIYILSKSSSQPHGGGGYKKPESITQSAVSARNRPR